ncbi:MAG TPA: LysR family transcriptional regulator [Solirubrobacteraceae bacterium]
MTLQQLAYFVAAARYGSFSAAAEVLHLAQPSLSEQVRRLEEELGVELFARTTRGLTLTEAGRTLRPEAEAALAAVDRARQSVIGVREVLTGTVTMGIFGRPPQALVTGVVQRFHEAHPGVRVRLVGQNSVDVAAAVRDGAAEAGLVALPIDDAGLDVRPIARDEIVYATTDARRARRPVRIEQLAEAPLVLYDSRYGTDDPTRRQLAERAQRAGRRVAPVIEVEDFDVAVRIAAAGLADTIVASRFVRTAAFPEGLHTVSLAEPMFDVFAFVTRRGAVLSPAVRELVRLLEDEKGTLGAPL